MHEEMPRRGANGLIDGFQLWVNLPAAQKMGQPRYQEVTAQDIPLVEQGGVRVRLVAGEYANVVGPVQDIAAQPLYMDVTLAPDTSFTLPVAEGHTAVAYVFEGEGLFGVDETGAGEAVTAVYFLVFADGDHFRVQTGSDAQVRFMLMAGAPFHEPIVPYGPFVMNTEAEIRQALLDLRNGTFVI
jgi:redox-sensitive bicupin YhaK (pirin superfamily)